MMMRMMMMVTSTKIVTARLGGKDELKTVTYAFVDAVSEGM